MFCDVTLLTGADVKTFQGESGKKACIRRKRATPSLVCVCVCLSGVPTEKTRDCSLSSLQLIDEESGVLLMF